MKIQKNDAKFEIGELVTAIKFYPVPKHTELHATCILNRKYSNSDNCWYYLIKGDDTWQPEKALRRLAYDN